MRNDQRKFDYFQKRGKLNLALLKSHGAPIRLEQIFGQCLEHLGCITLGGKGKPAGENLITQRMHDKSLRARVLVAGKADL